MQKIFLCFWQLDGRKTFLSVFCFDRLLLFLRELNNWQRSKKSTSLIIYSSIRSLFSRTQQCNPQLTYKLKLSPWTNKVLCFWFLESLQTEGNDSKAAPISTGPREKRSGFNKKTAKEHLIYAFLLPFRSFFEFLLLMVTAYDQYIYTPIQVASTPLVQKIPRKVNIRGTEYEIFTANIVTYRYFSFFSSTYAVCSVKNWIPAEVQFT